jgi:hypothetical protein
LWEELETVNGFLEKKPAKTHLEKSQQKLSARNLEGVPK